MPKRITLIAISIIISWLALNAQVQIKKYHFAYHKLNREDCEAQSFEFTYPCFFENNGRALSVINDSVKAILLSQHWNEGSYLADFIENKKDVIINIGDCDSLINPGCTILPEEGVVNYTILISNDQLLSFTISSSFHAGSGGAGSINRVYPFCYDLKEGKLIGFTALFPDKFDTLLLHRTDSLYLDEIGREELNELFYFTGGVGMEEGNLVFYYANRWSGKSWYQGIIIPYEEYEKHLLPRYRKLLKPVLPH